MSCLKVLSICSVLFGISSILVGLIFYKDRVVDLLVTTDHGVLRGVSHGYYQSFEGVPYAEPPVGPNRFQPPKPFETRWEGERSAEQQSSHCIQWDHLIFTGDRVSGSEDCLYLNIYTPKADPTRKYPVLFYIHGGAFMFGKGSFYGPKYLLDRPMILVNLNYRLGPMGFLSTEDSVVPGNMGLKDQNLALKWVKQNIEKFGGDPDRITITGYSAGGASVHLHYLSKLSAGLFQNGISHSGCALNPWVFTEDPLTKTKFVALTVGCPTGNTKAMVDCMRQKPAKEIVATMHHFQPFLYNPFTPFGPVIEPPSATAFISESPLALIERGETANVPWLVSQVADEGVYPAGEFAMDDGYIFQLNKNWEKIAPHVLDFNWTVPMIDHKAISREIRRFYLNQRTISRQTLPTLIKIITDRLYAVGIQKSVKLQSVNANTPTYFYYFKFNSVYGVENAFVPDVDHDLGVAHGDDVLLIYEVDFRSIVPYTSEELKMQKLLIDMYFNYATNGFVTL